MNPQASSWGSLWGPRIWFTVLTYRSKRSVGQQISQHTEDFLSSYRAFHMSMPSISIIFGPKHRTEIDFISDAVSRYDAPIG